MRRRPLYRILALPLALWFVALATDVGGIDACPMHDAMMHHMTGAMPGMSMAQMPGTSMAQAASMAGTPDTPAPTQQHGPMQCTCMGVCCGCAMATLPAPHVAPVAAAPTVRQPVRVERGARVFAAATPHRLPPSIGPPALHIV